MAQRRAQSANARGRAAEKPKPKSHHLLVDARQADHRPSSPPSPRQFNSLEEFGYIFRDGKLQSIVDGKPFQYQVYRDAAANHRRYAQIGKLVEKFVYRSLIDDCGLQVLSIPIDPRPNEPSGFIFASDDYKTARYLMIIIHGTGSVRAGQWSRKLIINNGLSEGSQIEYIRTARKLGYGVIVTNTNMHTDESSAHSTGLIRVSATPEQHGCYVWETYVRQNRHAAICIVAHSYGGAVVLAMAKNFPTDFQNRVFAIALTDSPMQNYSKAHASTLLAMLQKKTINWIASNKPADTDLRIVRNYGRLRSAGHLLHEWTSHTAFIGVFKFFEQERMKLEKGKK